MYNETSPNADPMSILLHDQFLVEIDLELEDNFVAFCSFDSGFNSGSIVLALQPKGEGDDDNRCIRVYMHNLRK